MKKVRNDQFFSNLEKFVNKVYPNQPQRQPYLNLKSWPSPRDEAWKFSRLGKLARKNILPQNLENQQNININKLNTNQKINLTIDQSNNQLKEFILKISNTELALSGCLGTIINFRFGKSPNNLWYESIIISSSPS